MNKTKTKSKPTWEIKDRLYELTTKNIPPVFIMKSRGILWFDEELGYEREIKYCRNQKTVFVDEMKGPRRVGQIVFRNGKLFVEKNMQTLQKFLSLYHPGNGSIFKEYNAEVIAKSDLDIIEIQLEAMNLAKDLEIERAEAILRTEYGSEVAKMTSKELKRDVLVFAQRSPELFLELVNDENINIRNVGIKAVENGIIKLSNDQRTFRWSSNDRVLLKVPFDENPYSALASWFKTDEGIEVYQMVEKKLK